MVCELKEIPKKQRQFFDMSVCCDCGTIQINKKKAGDHCENPNCECEAWPFNHKGSKKDGMLHWTNINWG